MSEAKAAYSRASRVDAACDEFESAWKAGKQPRIDSYVARAEEADRESLRSALLAIEVELRERSVADTSVTRSSMVSSAASAPGATALMRSAGQSVPPFIGRFSIRDLLGSGAFGKVYRAVDPELGRDVAIKVPLAEVTLSANEKVRFLKEARSAATINHPNVCQIFEVGEHSGQPYIVMAIVPGQSLSEVLKSRKEPLPTRQIAQIVRKIALALAAAHERGVVHRDLKPANVMFDRERKDIVVMDFGLARGPRLGQAHATQTGVIMGTPAYMSPEQARGDSKGVGPEGDIYSLGVILYELLTGTRPFAGTTTEVIGQILHVEPQPPSQRRVGVDGALETACLKALAKNPAERFASMKEFAKAVETAARATSLAGSPTVDTARATNTKAEAEGESAGPQMSEVFAVLSAERKVQHAATAAALEAAVQRSRTPRWVWATLLLTMLGGFSALGVIVFFTQSDKVRVTVELTDVDLADKSLSFFLDVKPISAEELANPIELKPGEHVLVVKRGNQVVKRMLLTVTGGRQRGLKVKDITPPLVEETKKPEAKKPEWKPLIKSADELIEGETRSENNGTRSVTFENGNLVLKGAGAAFKPKFTGKNYIVRANVLSVTETVHFSVRRGKGHMYQAFFHGRDRGWDWPTCGFGKQRAGEKWQDIDGTLQSVADEYPAELAVACFGDQLSIYVNGERVLRVTDNDGDEGGIAIGCYKDFKAVMRDVSVCVLDGTTFTPDDIFQQKVDPEVERILSPEFLTPELKKQNLLRNGGFESGTDDWRFESWRNRRDRATVVVKPVHSGDGVLEIKNPENDSVQFRQTVKVTPNRRYLLSGWIRTKGIVFHERNRAGACIYAYGWHRHRSAKVPVDADWTYDSVIFNSGNRDKLDVAVMLGGFGGTVSGTAWYDDICLVEIPNPPPPPQNDAGFSSLFNGKDLTGWKSIGGPKWSWAENRLLAFPDKTPGFLVTEAEYRDFELELEYRLAAGAGSGLFLHADASYPASGKGQLEVQLADDDAFPQLTAITKTGAIYNVFPRKADPPINRNGWNTLRVRLVKRHIEVWINGTQTIGADLDSASDKLAAAPGLTREKGGIGLQQNQQANVEFRNAHIKTLPR
jgi:serine/threonine protein kinase